MRLVQCTYCGQPGQWQVFDTEVKYQGSPGAPLETKLTGIAICDVDLERYGPPALPKRGR